MDQQHHEIINGLLWSNEAKRAYQHSPEFRAGVTVIARTLPKFIKIMAEESLEEVDRKKSLIRRIEREGI